MAAVARKFKHATAKRGPVPLIVGLIGPSGTGKTKSALRLADGMARLDKRPTFFIDTEGGRGKHYADEHRFEYMEFDPPHSAVDYEAALDHAIAGGAGRVVIDSMSHEHEGKGGLLEWHKAELERMGNDPKKSVLAYAAPKQARKALISRMVCSGVDLILCFRALPKIKPAKGGPIALGFMPIGGWEFMFDMTLKLLLLPGARGVPTFRSNFPGEQEMIKLPGQFDALFARSPQLSEDVGEQLARWAGGGQAAATASSGGLPELLTRLGACSDRDALDMLADEARAAWKQIGEAERKRVKSAMDAAATRVKMLEAQAASAARALAESVDEEGKIVDEGSFMPPVDDAPPPAAAPDRAA